LAKALGLGDTANSVRSLFPGQRPQPQMMADSKIPNFADIPYAQGPEAPAPSIARPAAPATPAVGSYNPPSGFGLSGTVPSPTAIAPPMPQPAMGIAPGTPPVVQKPAPTLQDRQQAYYQALSRSRDPSVAANARDHLMQLEERQATNQAITGLVSPENPNYKAVQAALSAGDVKGAMELARDETPTRTQLIENLSSLTPLSGMTPADMRRLATIDPEGFSKSYMTGFLQSIKPENRTDENDAFVEWHRANPRGTWLDFHRLWEQAGFKPAGASGGAKGAVSPRLGGGLPPGSIVPTGGQVTVNGGG